MLPFVKEKCIGLNWFKMAGFFNENRTEVLEYTWAHSDEHGDEEKEKSYIEGLTRYFLTILVK